jgi:hypothetical protein
LRGEGNVRWEGREEEGGKRRERSLVKFVEKKRQKKKRSEIQPRRDQISGEERNGDRKEEKGKGQNKPRAEGAKRRTAESHLTAPDKAPDNEA